MRDERGFSLVELLVALTVFMVAILGLVPLLLTQIQTNSNNLIRTRAQNLAMEVMESLQISDYALLPAQASAPAPFTHDPIPYTLAKTIDVNQPGRGQTRITVRVSWKRQGRLEDYQLVAVRTAP